jgi:hypothetical protein
MKHLRKFLRLSSADKWLLIRSALLLEVIKLGMWLLPFRILRRLVAQTASTSIEALAAERPPADTITWAIETASNYTPGNKSCLNQALAAQVLLTRRGYPALLHIGVAKGEQGHFRAHAWVESEGRVVIGGSELDHFTPLTVLEGREP